MIQIINKFTTNSFLFPLLYDIINVSMTIEINFHQTYQVEKVNLSNYFEIISNLKN